MRPARANLVSRPASLSHLLTEGPAQAHPSTFRLAPLALLPDGADRRFHLCYQGQPTVVGLPTAVSRPCSAVCPPQPAPSSDTRLCIDRPSRAWSPACPTVSSTASCITCHSTSAPLPASAVSVGNRPTTGLDSPPCVGTAAIKMLHNAPPIDRPRPCAIPHSQFQLTSLDNDHEHACIHLQTWSFPRPRTSRPNRSARSRPVKQDQTNICPLIGATDRLSHRHCLPASVWSDFCTSSLPCLPVCLSGVPSLACWLAICQCPSPHLSCRPPHRTQDPASIDLTAVVV